MNVLSTTEAATRSPGHTRQIARAALSALSLRRANSFFPAGATIHPEASLADSAPSVRSPVTARVGVLMLTNVPRGLQFATRSLSARSMRFLFVSSSRQIVERRFASSEHRWWVHVYGLSGWIRRQRQNRLCGRRRVQPSNVSL